MWDYTKESYNEKDVKYKINRLRLIRTTDPHHYLVNLRDDNEYYKGYYDSLTDFHADQFHGDNRKIKTITSQLATPPDEWAGNPVVLFISRSLLVMSWLA